MNKNKKKIKRNSSDQEIVKEKRATTTNIPLQHLR